MVIGSGFLFPVLSTVSSLLNFIRTTSPVSSDQENRGVEEDLNQLERMLRKIQATLRDAGEREIRDESVKLWLMELKDVSFDAEDVLDEYRYEILWRQAEAKDKKPAKFESIDLEAIAQRIRKIKMQFEDIARDRDALQLREEDGERYNTYGEGSLSLTSHMFDKSAIFGRRLDKEKILHLVLSEDAGEQLTVIPIVGMGGIGKTAIAQMVYSDLLIKENFDLMSWVHVSPNFNVLQITKDTFESASGIGYSGPTGLSGAQTALQELIKGKRLFLVLDDVRNECRHQWELFLQPFRAAKIVRIIVTARNKHVTEIMQTTDLPLLGRLPEIDCWMLFQHFAFGGQGAVENSSFVQIGKEIVAKCGGLPLAVKTIGALLSYKTDECSWREILVSELWESDGKDEIFPALKVSYCSLPPEIKPCFLYCSLFPRGFSFGKDQLIHMWMAQGYICPVGGKRPEDIGDRYFSELYMRSFIQSGIGEGSFRLHDLIHDLARAISTGEFFTLYHGKFCNLPGEIRHSYITSKTFKCRFSKPGLLRTLNFAVSDQASQQNFENSILNINDCIRLRVLVFPYYHLTSLQFFSSLKHLRYLRIVHCNLERLPESICLLFNLEILELINFPQLSELPIDIGKLFNLRYFYISGASIRNIPESMFELDNLQTLIVEYCPLIEELPDGIGNLVNLRSLSFCYNHIKSVPQTICHLSKLQLLDLRGNMSFEELLCDTREFLDQHSLDIWASLDSFPLLPRKLELWRPVVYTGLVNTSGRFSVTSHKRDLRKITNLASRSGRFSIPSRKIINYFLRRINQNWVDDYVSWRNKQVRGFNNYGVIDVKYRKTKGLLESLEPHNDLIELSINGYKGVAYPKWRNSPVVTKDSLFILMKCYIEEGSFLTVLCQLPSLKYLCLRGMSNIRVLGHAFSRTTHGQTAMPVCAKMLFPSLQDLRFKDMLEWKHWGMVEGFFPKLKSLSLKSCPKLSGLPILASLVKLDIRRCSITEVNLDQPRLEDIHIEDCWQLITLLGLQNCSSKLTLYIARCPLLVFLSNQMLLPEIIHLEIIDCPGLKEWCEKQSYLHVYKQVSSCKSLIISDITKLVKYGPQNFLSLAHLLIEGAELSNQMLGSTINLFPSALVSLSLISCNLSDNLHISSNLYKLRRLEIRSCLKLKSLKDLHKLSSLSCLVLWDCPLLSIQSETMIQKTYPEIIEEDQAHNFKDQAHIFIDLAHIFKDQAHNFKDQAHIFIDLAHIFKDQAHIFINEDQEVRRKKKGQLPPLLESLVIHGCHSMLSLHLVLDYPSMMSEVQVTNCSRLMYIEGLRDLNNLKTMAFMGCPQLLLDLLDSVPECVVISGCPRLTYWCKLHAIVPLDPLEGEVEMSPTLLISPIKEMSSC